MPRAIATSSAARSTPLWPPETIFMAPPRRSAKTFSQDWEKVPSGFAGGRMRVQA
jgi:hypothetical protein